MPTAAGPNTKGEENLVFAYDLGDVSNSYKGEPTTNFIAELGDPTQEITRGEFGQYYNLVDIFETHGLVPYTLSMDIKGNIPGSCLVYMQNSSYTKYAFPLGSVNITTEWQRFSFKNRTPSGPTSAWQTNTPNDNRAMLATYTGYGSGRNPTVRNMQLELGVHETPFTPGTRSATQGLLDLTGNSTINLSNVSFDSNAQMTFDGTSDKVEFSSYLTTLDTSVLSLEFVFRTNIGTGTYQPLLGWHYGRAGHGYVCLGNFTGMWGNESISFYNEGEGATPLSFAYTNGHSFLGDTNYHHAIIVLQTGNYRIFVDGEEVAVNASFRNGSQSTVMQSNLFGYGTEPKVGIGVGSQTEGYFNGRIPITKIYNRALTASEIKSNFNAIKGRFNIL